EMEVRQADVTARRRPLEARIAALEADLPNRFPPSDGLGLGLLPGAFRRKEHLERKFNEWLKREESRAIRWTVLRPVEAKSNLPRLEVLDDSSVFSSGDQTKRDVYNLKFRLDQANGLRKLAGAGPGPGAITAIRLEVLPDERLPKHGPGRVFYEGPFGDFFLSELTLTVDGRPVKLSKASHSFAGAGSSAGNAIDGKPETAWTINGGQGKAPPAVFNLAEPLAGGRELGLSLLFEKYYAAGLGRFRLSVTTDTRPVEARAMPTDVEDLLLVPAQRRTAAQRDRLLKQFLSVAPELAGARAEIERLRAQLPAYPTTLVMQERPPSNPRPTFVHRRGEFLQPAEPVQPDVLSFLPPLPKGSLRNRLTLARWLVSPDNPLVGRVTVHRH